MKCLKLFCFFLISAVLVENFSEMGAFHAPSVILGYTLKVLQKWFGANTKTENNEYKQSTFNVEDTLGGKKFRLKGELRCCQDPMQLHMEINGFGEELKLTLDAPADIPIPGASVASLGYRMYLTTKFEYTDNGDIELKIGFKAKLLMFDLPNVQIINKTFRNLYCYALIRFWNSQCVFFQVLLFALICITIRYCCRNYRTFRYNEKPEYLAYEYDSEAEDERYIGMHGRKNGKKCFC